MFSGHLITLVDNFDYCQILELFTFWEKCWHVLYLKNSWPNKLIGAEELRRKGISQRA